MRYTFLYILISFFNAVYAQQPIKILEKDGHSITSVSFSPDGKYIASGGSDNNAIIWDIASSTPINILKGHKDIILSTSYSEDGLYLATASKDKTIIVWSVQKGTHEKIFTGHTAPVTSVKFSRDGKLLISGSADFTAIVWDVATGLSKKIIDGHSKEVSSIAISSDNSWFATGSFDGDIKLWNMQNFEQMRNITPQSGKVRCMATGLNSDQLAVGFEDKSVKLINVKTSEISKIFKGHTNIVYDLEFSPDDKYLASGGLDNVVKVWNIDSSTCVRTYTKFYNFVSLHFSPDGKQLATAELNSKIKLWDISSLNINPATKKAIIAKPAFKPATTNNNKNPELEIVQPKLVADKKFLWLEKEIVIKGSVKSDNGIYEVLLNGVELVLDNGNTFSYTLKLAYRDNPITLKITDTYGNITEKSFVIERQIKIESVNDTLKREGQDYALIIASDDYQNYPHLMNPVNDGNTIAKELRDSYGFQTQIVNNPKLSDLYAILKEYSKKVYADDDQLFIFIAGHGEFNEDFKQGYLVVNDSKLNDESTLLSHSNLKTIINNIPCKHILLVMDACFGGTFDDFLAESRGAEKSYEDIDRDKFILKKLQYKTRKYLTSGGKEYVPDGTPGQHSPFTRKYLEALRSYGGEDGILTFSEIYTYVEKVTPSPRAGEFGTNQPGSDFLFISKW